MDYTIDENGVLRFVPEGSVLYRGVEDKDRDDVVKIVVPEGVKDVLGAAPCGGCKNLLSAQLPEGLSVITSDMFNSDSALESVNIPKSVEKICERAFARCESLREIDLPEGIDWIGRNAFWQSGLKKIELPESVKEICSRAFENCNRLEEVTFKGEYASLGDGVFAGCDELKSVTLPSNLKGIPVSTFINCASLEDVNIPKTVTRIEDSAFANCTSLRSVELPPELDWIGREAFKNCCNLENVTLPDSVRVLSNYAFYGCSNLKRLNLSSGLSEIEYNAFDGIPDDTIIKYNDAEFPKKYISFTDDLSDGLGFKDCLNILVSQREILQDDTFSPILVSRLAVAEHKDRLAETVEKYKKDFQTIGFYDISDNVDVEMKERLTRLFKENAATRGVVPRIIDALTIAATTLGIEPEYIVKSFEDRTFRDAIMAMRSCHEGNHFFDVEATLFAFNFDVNTIKQTILNNPHKDYASVLLCKGYKTGDEKYINLAKWISYHPDSSSELIEKLYNAQDHVDIAPDMSVEQARAMLSYGEGELEILRIEKEYEGKFSFKDCECNLPKTEVELGRYRAYIMDASDPRQVMLGYDTNCCQHLDGAGETAMMYGLAQPNAGFFVIEDKETGKIMAQAEVWEDSQGFRNTPFEKIDLEQTAKDDPKFVDEICSDLENYIEDGYCTNRYGMTVDPHDYFENELGLHCWIGGEKADVAIYGYYDRTVAHVGPYEHVHIFDLPEVFRLIAKDSCRMENFNECFNEYQSKGIHLERNGDLYRVSCEKVNNEILVFDNIEFADDRDIEQFAPILAKWCEASPYQDILMGDGYNAMNDSRIRHTEGVEPPINGNWVRLIDKDNEISNCGDEEFCDLYPSPDEAYDAIANRELNLEDCHFYELESFEDALPYTDADSSCSILKIAGNVESYFKDSLEEYRNKHPEMNDTNGVEPEKKKRKSRGR